MLHLRGVHRPFNAKYWQMVAWWKELNNLVNKDLVFNTGAFYSKMFCQWNMKEFVHQADIKDQAVNTMGF